MCSTRINDGAFVLLNRSRSAIRSSIRVVRKEWLCRIRRSTSTSTSTGCGSGDGGY